jgi:hypothetical protein
MGYYTNFELNVHQGKANMSEVKDALDTIMDTDSLASIFELENYNEPEYGDVSIRTADACKWYDHDEDCAQMSKQFPGVVFKLHGEGEEQGDMWEAYYKDGLCQICRALPPVFPPFDPNKLLSVQKAQLMDEGRR